MRVNFEFFCDKMAPWVVSYRVFTCQWYATSRSSTDHIECTRLFVFIWTYQIPIPSVGAAERGRQIVSKVDNHSWHSILFGISADTETFHSETGGTGSRVFGTTSGVHGVLGEMEQRAGGSRDQGSKRGR